MEKLLSLPIKRENDLRLVPFLISIPIHTENPKSQERQDLDIDSHSTRCSLSGILAWRKEVIKYLGWRNVQVSWRHIVYKILWNFTVPLRDIKYRAIFPSVGVYVRGLGIKDPNINCRLQKSCRKVQSRQKVGRKVLNRNHFEAEL